MSYTQAGVQPPLPGTIQAANAPSLSFGIASLELWLFQLRQLRQRMCMRAPSLPWSIQPYFKPCSLYFSRLSLGSTSDVTCFPAAVVGPYCTTHSFQPMTCWPCCPNTTGCCIRQMTCPRAPSLPWNIQSSFQSCTSYLSSLSGSTSDVTCLFWLQLLAQAYYPPNCF